MSAIAGIISLSQEIIPYQTVLQFDNVMYVQKHRGPDATGVCAFDFNKEVVFASNTEQIRNDFKTRGIIGHNLLCVNDKEQLQPYCNIDGSIGVAYDGYIVNLKEIKSKLQEAGYRFETEPPYEVLLAGYLEYGIEALAKQLNGVFVILVYDLNMDVIYIIGDRYGSKPMYYTEYNNRFLFSSELKGIIQVEDFDREIDIDACNARMIFARTGSRVLLKGVKLLSPSELITITAKGVSNTTYFSWDSYERDESLFESDVEAIEETEKLLDKVISRQMENKRMGVQLSGGIDSTLLAYYAKNKEKETFTEAVAIVEGTGNKGEEYYIDYVAKQLGLNLHKYQMSPDYFCDNYEKMIWHNDAPVYRPYFSCFMRLGEMAKNHADVLFCGEGADELAGGYSRFSGGVLVPFISSMDINNSDIKSYGSYAEYATMAAETCTDFTTLGYNNIEKLLQERMDIYNGFQGSDFTKHLKFEICECLPEASLRQDKMTMASSIQNRVPFLDNDIAELFMTMKEDYLVRFINKSPLNLGNNPFSWMQGKWILKEIVSKHFGYDFAYRKKMIMNLDERGMVLDSRFVEYVHDQVLWGMKNRGLFDFKKIENLFINAKAISTKEFTGMWKAICTETWCQLFIDNK